MVDKDFNMWLIEINSSPAMDYSTDITKRLVKTVLPDILKVVLDYNKAKESEQPNIDTGLFKLIHKGPVKFSYEFTVFLGIKNTYSRIIFCKCKKLFKN